MRIEELNQLIRVSRSVDRPDAITPDNWNQIINEVRLATSMGMEMTGQQLLYVPNPSPQETAQETLMQEYITAANNAPSHTAPAA